MLSGRERWTTASTTTSATLRPRARHRRLNLLEVSSAVAPAAHPQRTRVQHCIIGDHTSHTHLAFLTLSCPPHERAATMASMLLLLNSPSYWSPVAPTLRSRPALVSRSAPAAVSMAFALPGFGGKKQARPSEGARAVPRARAGGGRRLRRDQRGVRGARGEVQGRREANHQAEDGARQDFGGPAAPADAGRSRRTTTCASPPTIFRTRRSR